MKVFLKRSVLETCELSELVLTLEPLDRFAVDPNFGWGTRENHGNVLSLVLRF